MSTDNAAVVTRFLESVAAFDVAGAISCLHPEVEVVEADSLPYGGTHIGADGLTTIFTKLMEGAQPTFRGFEVLDAGTRVIGRMDLSLRSHVTGQELQTQVVEIYTLEDGLITHADVFYKDTKAVCDILGMVV